jgi:subtilisin family serine protease
MIVTIWVILFLLEFSLAMYNDRNHRTRSSFNSQYGPWIVQLIDPSSEHDPIESAARLFHYSYRSNPRVHREGIEIGFHVSNRFKHALNAIVIQGVLKDDLLSINGVKQVDLDNIKYIASISWGIDRIDQLSSTLSLTYSPAYMGTGVDVFVIDTGIDTTNIDFADVGNSRNVSNIFNTWGALSANTDDNGHGTHCAGFIFFVFLLLYCCHLI